MHIWRYACILYIIMCVAVLDMSLHLFLYACLPFRFQSWSDDFLTSTWSDPPWPCWRTPECCRTPLSDCHYFEYLPNTYSSRASTAKWSTDWWLSLFPSCHKKCWQGSWKPSFSFSSWSESTNLSTKRGRQPSVVSPVSLYSISRETKTTPARKGRHRKANNRPFIT